MKSECSTAPSISYTLFHLNRNRKSEKNKYSCAVIDLNRGDTCSGNYEQLMCVNLLIFNIF